MQVEDYSWAFRPFDALAVQLLPMLSSNKGDGSHDVSHLARVWKNITEIQKVEGGSLQCLAAACLLHDSVHIEKNAPNLSNASTIAADNARQILTNLDWSRVDIEVVAHAIEAHSFAAGVTPNSIEAKILQDSDRLDAIGMVGVARCFYVGGRLGSDLYHPTDPSAVHRPLDDKSYVIDHFYTKLLTLSEGLQTSTGRHMADKRAERLRAFLTSFLDEVALGGPGKISD